MNYFDENCTSISTLLVHFDGILLENYAKNAAETCNKL